MLLRLLEFLIGLALIVFALRSALRVLVMPRSASDRLARMLFRSLAGLFRWRARKLPSYKRRDALMAVFAPLGLMLLLPLWLSIVLAGYAFMFYAIGIRPFYDAFVLSGSSLFTLGFERADGPLLMTLIFTESTIGLILVALVIAYLPTMYAAFSRRELAVTLLEVRAGSPPTALEMVRRVHRLGRWDELGQVWQRWEEWFADIQETHTTLAALVFFRSPQADHSWVRASEAVMDTAAFVEAAVDVPTDIQGQLVIRAGYLALRRIAEAFNVPFDPDPQFPQNPISIQRDEFMAACDMLAAEGLPIRADLDQAWQDFAGWRVNYDTVLTALLEMTMAPAAPWSIDLLGISRTETQTQGRRA